MASSPNLYQRVACLAVAISRSHFDEVEKRDPILDELGDPGFWAGRQPGLQSRRGHLSMYIDDPHLAAIGVKRTTRLACVVACVFKRAGLPTSDKSQGPSPRLELLGLDFHAESTAWPP